MGETTIHGLRPEFATGTSQAVRWAGEVIRRTTAADRRLNSGSHRHEPSLPPEGEMPDPGPIQNPAGLARRVMGMMGTELPAVDRRV